MYMDMRMEIKEIVELDQIANSIEEQAVEKGYSDSDQHRWRVAEEVTRQLEAGLSQRELAGMMSNTGDRRYDQSWIARNRTVWVNFGSDVPRVHHFGTYIKMVQILPKGDFDAILEEASRTGQSPATIAKRIASELRAAKKTAKEAVTKEKNTKKQQRITQAKESVKQGNDVVVKETVPEVEDSEETIIRRFDSELSGIKKRSLDLIDLAADELIDVRVDVRLTINQHIDELINILNNAKLVISGTAWKE